MKGNDFARAYVQAVWEREALERRGLPESSLAVEQFDEGYFAILRARPKCKHLYCRLPGIPKDPKTLLWLIEGVVDFLVAEALKLPDVPKEQRVHEVGPGRFFIPGLTQRGGAE